MKERFVWLVMLLVNALLSANQPSAALKHGGQVGENPAARSAAVFSLSTINLRGRSNAPPPAGRGLKVPTFFHFLTFCHVLIFIFNFLNSE